jgi:branched-chain amino acid transport system substrate-binding protein
VKLRIVAAAALLLTLTLAGAGYSRPDAVPTYKIGAIFDRSGPTADVGVPYSDGVRAYISWFNGSQKKFKLSLLAQDTGYDTGRSQAFYEQLRTSGIVAISGWATRDTEAFKARVAADRLPYVSASYAESVANPRDTPYNFFVAPSYSQQMRIALRYIAKLNPNREVKVAVFYNDSPFGTSPLEDGKAYIERKRLRINYEPSYPMRAGATDFTAQLTQVRDADYIVVQNTSAPAATLARDVARLGLNAKLVLLNWAADELFVALAGRAANGAYGIQPFGTTALKVKGLLTPTRYLERTTRQSIHRKGIHYVQGWYTTAVLAEAIKRLVASGKRVDGPSIKSTLESMPAFDTGGVTAKVKFSPTYHAGQRSSRVFQVQRGRFRQVAGFTVP